jgi:aspartate/methionine/tyrosine aminotransferase
MPNKLATELNEIIGRDNPNVFGMLSEMAKELFFPKGILTQSAEAKQKAHRYNATIGIAKENGHAMHLSAVMDSFDGLGPDEVLPYAPSPGRPDLRAKWKELLLQKNPTLVGKDVSLPVVTSGITHGLSIVADMFLDPGDTLLLPDMFWGNYNMIFKVRRNATIAHYPFFDKSGPGIDTAGFRKAILEHASGDCKRIVVLLNFPHNPSGYSITEAEGDAIRDALHEAAEKNDCKIVAVSDDAYFGLFYEPQVMKESLFTRLADCHENILAVKLDGATKEDYVWGLRVGFITYGVKGGSSDTYQAMEKKTGGLIRGTISNCPHHSQAIVFKAMSNGDYARQRQEKFVIMSARAAKVKEVLTQDRFADAWVPYPFNSGYFMCVKLNDLDAETFRVRLLEEYGIGVIASGKTDIRIAFSCLEEADIAPLFDAMFECAQEMKGS